jgi:lipopolysaccharide transport system permease protein
VAVTDSKFEFAIILFIGLSLVSIMNDTLGKSPELIISNPVYVKKMVFPIEMLSVVTIGSALFHFLICLLIIFATTFWIRGFIPLTAMFIPVLLLPYLVMLLGLSWILCAAGVYLRDLRHAVVPMITLLSFLGPVFYPLTALPQEYRSWVFLNPITFPIEQLRRVLLEGLPPEWIYLLIYIVASAGIVFLGSSVFQRLRGGFADVL